VWTDLRHAVRLLFRERTFAAAAVLTLALGVGANLAVFAVVEAVLLRPLPYEAADDIVILNHRDERTGLTKDFVAMGDLVDMAARQSSLESLLAYNAGRSTVYGFTEPVMVNVLQIQPEVFDLFRLRVLHGRAFVTADAQQGAAPVVVLGHDFWRTQFGADPSVVGKRLRMARASGRSSASPRPGSGFLRHGPRTSSCRSPCQFRRRRCATATGRSPWAA
jgi:hypothetical protein